MRRSTIEVHPIFSEAPHLRSSVSHAKTDFSTNHTAFQLILPWFKLTKTPLFETRLAFRRFWMKVPRDPQNTLAEMCYLYRKRRLMAPKEYDASVMAAAAVLAEIHSGKRYAPALDFAFQGDIEDVGVKTVNGWEKS